MLIMGFMSGLFVGRTVTGSFVVFRDFKYVSLNDFGSIKSKMTICYVLFSGHVLSPAKLSSMEFGEQ